MFENISLVYTSLVSSWFFFTAVYDCIGKLASSSQSITFSTETIVTGLSKFSCAAKGLLTYKYKVGLCVNGVKLSVILPFLLDWRYAPSLAVFLMETRLTATRKHKSCDRPPQGICRANSNRKNTGALSLSTIYLTWKPKNLLKKLNFMLITNC